MTTTVDRIIPYETNWLDNPIHEPINVILGILATFLLIHIMYSVFASGNGLNLSYISTMSGIFNTLSMIFTFASIASMNKLNSLGWTYEKLIAADQYLDHVIH